MWFTLIFFIIILLVSWLYCRCFPWVLYMTLYVFYLMYILLSYGGKIILDKLRINPFAYLFISFFTKVILVAGFAFLLIEYFSLERNTILLLLVSGYIVAAIFDFILLSQMKQPKRP